MIDDDKKINPHPNDCAHTSYHGLCPACAAGVYPELTAEEIQTLQGLPEWDRLYALAAIIKEKCLNWKK